MKEPSANKISSRTIHSGRVFAVVSDLVKLPNGRETAMDVVRHPPSVVLIPMLDSTHVVLVRQYRYSIDRWIWELPAGTLEPDEDMEIASRRECQEETGYTPRHVYRLGSFYPTPGYCDELMFFFRLTGLTTPSCQMERDDDEILEPQVFQLDDARRLTRDADVMDMKTVLGLSLV